MAVLHDTVLILDDLVEQRVRLPALVVEPARAAIAAYVKSVPLLIDPPGDEPPPPPFDGLRSAGVPLRPTAQTDSTILRAAPTRRAVAGVLSHQGWAWPL